MPRIDGDVSERSGGHPPAEGGFTNGRTQRHGGVFWQRQREGGASPVFSYVFVQRLRGEEGRR